MPYELETNKCHWSYAGFAPCLMIINMAIGNRGSSLWNNLFEQCNSYSFTICLKGYMNKAIDTL